MREIKRPASWLFIAGIVSIAVGTYFDATFEKESLSAFLLVKGDTFSFDRVLFEEVPELYASLFFLYSMFLLYKEVIKKECHYFIARMGGAVIVLGAIIAGVGNSFLLEDHGNTIVWRVITGIIIYFVGIQIPFQYFKRYPISQVSETQG